MHPPCPAPFNLTDYVLSGGITTPGKVALEICDLGRTQQWTYADLRQAVLATATGLQEAGLDPGNRLLIRLSNSAHFPILYLAAIAADVLPIAVSAQLTDGEIAKIALCAKPNAAAFSPGLEISLDLPTISEADLTRMRHLPMATPIMGDPNRPGYIVFTSGTSGIPKGVIHAHRSIWARRMMWDGWYGLDATDRMLHAGAFNWTYTLGTGLLDPWAAGAAAIVPGPTLPRDDLGTLIADTRATIFAAAPGVYRRLLRNPLPSTPNLRHGLSAGESLPRTLRQSWRDQTGTDLHEAYGLTECSTFISGAPQRPAPGGTTGFAQKGRIIRITPDGGLQIHRSDPGLMLGTLDGLLTQDWFDTGDTAKQDDTGAITLLGRSDDILNAGGFRVSPMEVEAALALHPAVDEAAVVEVRATPDTTLIAAFYTGTETAHKDLLTHCARHLARYKCPHSFTHVTSLPRGANNKLLRRSLRISWETLNGPS